MLWEWNPRCKVVKVVKFHRVSGVEQKQAMSRARVGRKEVSRGGDCSLRAVKAVCRVVGECTLDSCRRHASSLERDDAAAG